MPDRLASALLLASLCFAFALGSAFAFDPAEFDKATTTILCDCGCHPQSVHACACGRAAQMRGEIRALIEKGMTGEEVVASYVERSGEQIRITPEATGFNLLAWLGPLVGLFVAVGGLTLLLRRWAGRRPPDEEAPLTKPPLPGTDDPYMARLQRDLEELR